MEQDIEEAASWRNMLLDVEANGESTDDNEIPTDLDQGLSARFNRFLANEKYAGYSLQQLRNEAQTGDVLAEVEYAERLLTLCSSRELGEYCKRYRTAVHRLEEEATEVYSAELASYRASKLVILGRKYEDGLLASSDGRNNQTEAFLCYQDASELDLTQSDEYLRCLRTGIGCTVDSVLADKKEKDAIRASGFEKKAMYACRLYEENQKLACWEQIQDAMGSADADQYPGCRAAMLLLQQGAIGEIRDSELEKQVEAATEQGDAWACYVQSLLTENEALKYRYWSRAKASEGLAYVCCDQQKKQFEQKKEEFRLQQERERLAQIEAERLQQEWQMAERLQQARKEAEAKKALKRENRKKVKNYLFSLMKSLIYVSSSILFFLLDWFGWIIIPFVGLCGLLLLILKPQILFFIIILGWCILRVFSWFDE